MNDKNDLRIIDNAYIVAFRLNVITCMLRSDKLETLDNDDICCAHTLICDILEECVSMLRNEVQ